MVVRLFVWVLGGVWDPIHEGGNMQNAIFVTVIMLTGRKTPWRKIRAGYILAAVRTVLLFGSQIFVGPMP